MPPVVDIALVQHQQREIHHGAGHHHGNQFHDLDAARRAAEDVADFEILQQLARHRARNADHRGHAQHRDHAARPGTPSATISSAAMITVESVRPGNRIIRRSDHAHQVARNGGEAEADDQHDDAPRPTPATMPLRQICVEHDHQRRRHHEDPEQHHARAHVALGARRGSGGRGAGLQFLERARQAAASSDLRILNSV